MFSEALDGRNANLESGVKDVLAREPRDFTAFAEALWTPKPAMNDALITAEVLSSRRGRPGTAGPVDMARRTVWADDLVSVHHSDQWIFVVDTERPLAPTWLDLLRRRAEGGARSSYGVVTATFDGPAPPGAFRVVDLDATTHSTLVHVEDRRSRPAGQASVRARLPATHIQE